MLFLDQRRSLHDVASDVVHLMSNVPSAYFAFGGDDVHVTVSISTRERESGVPVVVLETSPGDETGEVMIPFNVVVTGKSSKGTALLRSLREAELHLSFSSRPNLQEAESLTVRSIRRCFLTEMREDGSIFALLGGNGIVASELKSSSRGYLMALVTLITSSGRRRRVSQECCRTLIRNVTRVT